MICFQAVDPPLLDPRDPRAARVEPAAFVEAPVAVEVFLAVDLESVLVIAPLIDPGAVRDDETTQ